MLRQVRSECNQLQTRRVSPQGPLLKVTLSFWHRLSHRRQSEESFKPLCEHGIPRSSYVSEAVSTHSSCLAGHSPNSACQEIVRAIFRADETTLRRVNHAYQFDIGLIGLENKQ